MTLRGNVSGCRDVDEVDICYYPFQAIVALGVYPSPLGGPLLAVMAPGDGFCRQSVLQTATSGCTRNLNLRAFEGLSAAWGYVNATGVGGWVYGPALADNNSAGGCCGPAQADYRCGDAKAGICPDGPCDGTADPNPAIGVSGSRTITASLTTLRWAPGSTAYYYLPNGATVQQFVRTSDGNWTCVEVTNGLGYAANGSRGWVLTSSL